MSCLVGGNLVSKLRKDAEQKGSPACNSHPPPQDKYLDPMKWMLGGNSSLQGVQSPDA